MNINVVYSTSHWVVPKIIIAILVVLGVIIFVTEGRARVKAGEPFIKLPESFFIEGYDKIKFWGTLVLFALYIIAMGLVGFVPGSIVFILLFNILFATERTVKSIIMSAVISIVSTLLIWYLFGVVFNISLPRASLF